MDIALQNFGVHAFRAAFQMVNVPLFKTNLLFFQSFHFLWIFYSMLYVWSLFIHPHVQYDSKVWS